MHLFVLVESLPDGHEQWKNWISSVEFSTGGHPVCREIRLYDINCKSSDVQFMVNKLMLTEVDILHDDSSKSMESMAELATEMLPIDSIKDLKIEAKQKIEEGKIGELIPGSYNDRKRHWVHTFLIGKVDDNFDKTGVEMI